MTADERLNNPNRPRRVTPSATALLACASLLHESLVTGRSGARPSSWGQGDLEMAVAAVTALLGEAGGGLEVGPSPSDTSPPPRPPLEAPSEHLARHVALVLGEVVYGPQVATADGRARVAKIAEVVAGLWGPRLLEEIPSLRGMVEGPQADPHAQLQALAEKGGGDTLEAEVCGAGPLVLFSSG